MNGWNANQYWERDAENANIMPFVMEMLHVHIHRNLEEICKKVYVKKQFMINIYQRK